MARKLLLISVEDLEPGPETFTPRDMRNAVEEWLKMHLTKVHDPKVITGDFLLQHLGPGDRMWLNIPQD